MELPQISPEQKEIIQKLNNKNLIIDSVAGSGKTTTNIYIAKHYSNNNILLLTYNAKLKIETRTRIKKLGITNLECHSYHSFCVKYYYDNCFTDSEIKKIISTNMKSKKVFTYDMIILDEAQDITNLYYELICKINCDNNSYAKLCLLGDKYQSIYEFNNADERYLTYADQLFVFNDLYWDKCNLTTSFRITNTMSDFINKCMLKYNRIDAFKISKYKPRYVICKVFPNEYSTYYPIQEIKYYLKMGYKPNEIFVLAPSIKSRNCPARMLENYIKTKLPHIPIYVPTSDEAKIDDDVIASKLIFSTYHQAKGLERKVVIVFGFDNGYFKYYKPDKDRNVCPNELYVACTRALEQLTLIHGDDNDFLPFLCKEKIDIYSIQIGNIGKIKSDIIKNDIDTQVTDLVRHLSTEIIDESIKYLDITNVRPIHKKINIIQKITESNGTEEVSEINGTAIPAYYEYHRTGNMTILNYCINPDIDENDFKNKKLLEFWKKHSDELHNIKETDDVEKNLLRVSSLYCSLRSGYMFKSEQLTKYNWIDNKILQKCIKRFDSLGISNDALYEEHKTVSNKDMNDVPELLNRKICGCIDCVDGKNIYEFKCVDKLEKTHYLQLAIYMYIHMIQMNRKNIESMKDTVSAGLKNIKQTDNVSYLYENIAKTGTVTKIYKNGSMNIRNSISNKIHKIQKTNLSHNVTYEKQHMLYNHNDYKYILCNVLTGEMNEIKCELNKLKQMVQYLIYSKYVNIKSTNDTEFIYNSKNMYSKYYD